MGGSVRFHWGAGSMIHGNRALILVQVSAFFFFPINKDLPFLAAIVGSSDWTDPSLLATKPSTLPCSCHRSQHREHHSRLVQRHQLHHPRRSLVCSCLYRIIEINQFSSARQFLPYPRVVPRLKKLIEDFPQQLIEDFPQRTLFCLLAGLSAHCVSATSEAMLV